MATSYRSIGSAWRGDGGGNAVRAIAFKGGAVADRKGTVATVGMTPPPLRVIAGPIVGGICLDASVNRVEFVLVPIKRL